MSKGFTKLQEDFPVFRVLNRTGVTRDIPTHGGEIVQVGPNAEGKVASADLYQLPDFRLFEMKSPDMATLVEYGLMSNPDAPVESDEDDDDSDDPADDAAPDESGTVNN